jgi:hypothetical protein
MQRQKKEYWKFKKWMNSMWLLAALAKSAPIFPKFTRERITKVHILLVFKVVLCMVCSLVLLSQGLPINRLDTSLPISYIYLYN